MSKYYCTISYAINSIEEEDFISWLGSYLITKQVEIANINIPFHNVMFFEKHFGSDHEAVTFQNEIKQLLDDKMSNIGVNKSFFYLIHIGKFEYKLVEDKSMAINKLHKILVDKWQDKTYLDYLNFSL